MANLSRRSSDDRKLDDEDRRDGLEAEGRQPLVRHWNPHREIAQRHPRTLALLAGDIFMTQVNLKSWLCNGCFSTSANGTGNCFIIIISPRHFQSQLHVVLKSWIIY